MTLPLREMAMIGVQPKPSKYHKPPEEYRAYTIGKIGCGKSRVCHHHCFQHSHDKQQNTLQMVPLLRFEVRTRSFLRKRHHEVLTVVAFPWLAALSLFSYETYSLPPRLISPPPPPPLPFPPCGPPPPLPGPPALPTPPCCLLPCRHPPPAS